MLHSSRCIRSWYVIPLSGSNPLELTAAADLLEDKVLAIGPSGPIVATGLSQSFPVDAKPYRCAYVLDTVERATTAFAQRDSSFLVRGQASLAPAGVVFMFPGVGEQYVGMAEGLYAAEPEFRDALDDCARILHDQEGIELLQMLYPVGRRSRSFEIEVVPGEIDLRALLGRQAPNADASGTTFAHLGLFAIEYSLAAWWISCGIRPAAMIGHSLGEYVAACISGVLSLSDALRVVVARAQLIERVKPGAMLAVAMDASDLAALIPRGVSISAINAKGLCVVSGTREQLAELQGDLLARGVVQRPVNATHAFHSSLMEPIRHDLERVFKEVQLNPPSLPYVSNLTGDWISVEEATDPRYWARHSCEAVRFAPGIEAVHRRGLRHYIETGPGHTLASFVHQQLGKDARGNLCIVTSLPGAQEHAPDEFVAARSQAELWCAGVHTSWNGCPAPETQGMSDTGSGDNCSKSDRDAARHGCREVLDDEPMDQLETFVAALWCQTLGVEEVKRNDNFFRLGGNSLVGMRLLARLRGELAVDCSIRMLFQYPVFDSFTLAVERALAAEPSGSNPESDEKPCIEVTATQIVLSNGLAVHQLNRAETNHFYHDIFEERVYERNGIVISPHAVIFDVGANIGLFSLYANSRSHGARIYAFEPAPPVFELLKMNLAPLGSSARLFNVGIGGSRGILDLTYYPLSTGMSSFYANEAEERAVLATIIENQQAQGIDAMDNILASAADLLDLRFTSKSFSCPIRTLSDVIEEFAVERIDLLKIDVQKSEVAVLDGIEAQHWPRIRQVVIETHDIGGRVSATSQHLQRVGFSVTVQQDPLYEGSNIYNLYAIRSII